MKTGMEWMRTSVGVSFHWTSHWKNGALGPDGKRLSYEDAINGFDTDRFVNALKKIGADHCLFTLTHAEQYLAFPNEVLESLLPGRTTKRDLIGEIIDGLHAEGIRFIAYYNHACNVHQDAPWEKACGYAEGIHGDLDLFAKNICDIVSFTAKRYGEKLSGWWFDSGYSLDPRGPHNSISCEMGDWQFPWENLICAAKSGNPACAVA